MLFIYFYLISYSIIGYGILSANLLSINKYNFGHLGILGCTFFLLISFTTSLFINHNLSINFIFIILGLLLFYFLRNKIIDFKKEIINHFIVFSLLLLFITVSKNHDDFPYYHFPYISILTEFSHPIGLGLLNNGFRSPSSIFFISSMFYLPGIKIFLFHITPALILGYSNLILLNKIFDKHIFRLFKLVNVISLISIIFINIFFYRLAEHGTDRSGMILVIISVILFLQVINLENKSQSCEIKFLIISLCFAITLKPFYLINIFLILLLLIYEKTRKAFLGLFFTKTFWYCISLISFIIFYTFINTGCLFFPLAISCFENLPWSLDIKFINDVKIWFELWSKAGASPNYVVDDRILYIKNFNWFNNWINQYFFNKVSDFILGLLILSIIIFLFFIKNIGKYNKSKISFYYLYILITAFLIEWFLYHPTLRYGGYHLIYLIIFIPFSIYLSKLTATYKIFYKKALILLIITSLIFSVRNIDRIYNEYTKYKFNPLVNLNYGFFGGDESFHFRYNSHLRKNYNNYNYIKILGKRFTYMSKENK